MSRRVRVGSGVRIGRCAPLIRSPERPEPSRAVQRQFWHLIATGITSAEAAPRVGASVPVGSRWLFHTGGMPPIALAEPTGRYLSFEERQEIALLRARQVGVPGDRRQGRTRPGDDLPRAAPQRGHTRREAGVPGAGRAVEGTSGRQTTEEGLATNDGLREYVQERLPSWANSGVTAGGQAKTDARDACVIAETLRHRGDLGEVEGRHLARDRAAAAGDPSHRPGGPNQRARRHWLPPSTPSESASPRRWSSSDGSAGP